MTSVVGKQTYQYDANGKRVMTARSGGNSTVYLYDAAGQLLHSVDSDGTKTIYVWLQDKLLEDDNFVSAHDNIWDVLGSTVMTMQDLPPFTATNYDPYGVEVPTQTHAIGYTGLSFDLGTGLNYAGARYYDAQVGRFISPDPFSLKESDPRTINRYAYAANNPYKYVDRSGTEASCFSLQGGCDYKSQINISGTDLLTATAIFGGVILTIETGGVAAAVFADMAEYGALNGFLMNAGAVNATGAVVLETTAAVATGTVAANSIAENAQNGLAFEVEGLSYVETLQTQIAPQVSVRPFTENGDLAPFRFVADAVGTNKNTGGLALSEFKSSESAPLTTNQALGHPLTAQYGAIIVGDNGLPYYPAGTMIPPTEVDVIRPSWIPEEY